jgi:hypothetical protein
MALRSFSRLFLVTGSTLRRRLPGAGDVWGGGATTRGKSLGQLAQKNP